MKKIFILVFAIGQLFSAPIEKLTINKQEFSLVINSYDIYDSKGSFIKFYKVDKDKNLTSVIRLTLKDVTGNCESKSLEDGAYEINKNVITLYSFWNRRGKAYLEPYGAKIQKYEVELDGTLKELSSLLYIEETRKKQDDDSGMEYLFHTPQGKFEQKKLNTYIKGVEEKYGGKFVFGEESKRLIKHVKEALKRKTKEAWRR